MPVSYADVSQLPDKLQGLNDKIKEAILEFCLEIQYDDPLGRLEVYNKTINLATKLTVELRKNHFDIVDSQLALANAPMTLDIAASLEVLSRVIQQAKDAHKGRPGPKADAGYKLTRAVGCALKDDGETLDTLQNGIFRTTMEIILNELDVDKTSVTAKNWVTHTLR